MKICESQGDGMQLNRCVELHEKEQTVLILGEQISAEFIPSDILSFNLNFQ